MILCVFLVDSICIPIDIFSYCVIFEYPATSFYQGRILPTGTRDSTLELLVGDNGWVTHHENGILYSFDATKCMFSSGNRSEKLRMARLYCENETVVDLFAGIGYFVLPFLVKYVHLSLTLIQMILDLVRFINNKIIFSGLMQNLFMPVSGTPML